MPSTTADILRNAIESIERLTQDKAEIDAEISKVKASLKKLGFDVPVVLSLIKERKMTPERLREMRSLSQVYRAALGMLDDTPLGDFARKRLDHPHHEAPHPPSDNDDEDHHDDAGTRGPGPALPMEGNPLLNPPPAPATPTEPEPPATTPEEAREQGRQAHAEGIRVVMNPYPAGNPLRAAWDEGWCSASGTDGMDIPDAWKPTKPAKPKKEKGKDKDKDNTSPPPAP